MRLFFTCCIMTKVIDEFVCKKVSFHFWHICLLSFYVGCFEFIHYSTSLWLIHYKTKPFLIAKFPIPYVKLVSLRSGRNRDNVVPPDVKVWTSPVVNDFILMDRKLVSSGSSLYSPTVRCNLFIQFVRVGSSYSTWKRLQMAAADEIRDSWNWCQIFTPPSVLPCWHCTIVDYTG